MRCAKKKAAAWARSCALAWRIWKKRRRGWKPIAAPFCAATRNGCNRAWWNCSGHRSTKNGFCRKWRARGSQRHPGRTGPAECAREAFSRFARPGWRGGQEDGLPAAGNEPRGEHPAFEDLGPGGRGLEGYRDRLADEVGDREIAGAGAESGMSIVYIVSAPSGSGKSTLVNELFKMVGHLDFSISYTTRPPFGSERNGKEYFFVSREEFEAMIAADEFLEHAEVFGNYYGTARRFLREAENRSNDLLLDIDVQGASKIKEKIPEAVSIFILPPDRDKLEWRLRTRGLDSEEVIRRRLDTARREIENYSKYDYILVNNVVEQSADELKDIVLAERLKKKAGRNFLKKNSG